MKRLSAISVAIGLAGCASPTLSGGNQAGGIISHTTDATHAEAFELANAHCKQFGKIARISGTDLLSSSMTFDCVAP